MIREPEPMFVADPLRAFERQGMLKLVAPAKVNLFLGVGGLRADGYHEVTTVMHALGLHDVVHMDYCPESTGGLTIELNCYGREGIAQPEIPSEDNLVTRAIRLLAKKLSREADESFRIRVEKHIPLEAGLGGGSSDAAAALVGAAKFWELDPLAPEVLAAAAELGSDVSFFLYGGCICLAGTGELFSHRLDPMKKSVLLIKPDKGVSTREAYALFDEDPVLIPTELAQQAQSAVCAEDVPLFNNLAPASEALYPELARVRSWLEVQPEVERALLCGSGSATFALCESFEAACRISALAQLEGWWARTTSFSAMRASYRNPSPIFSSICKNFIPDGRIGTPTKGDL